MRTVIKRIASLGLGIIFLFFTKDIVWKITGGLLLLWFILDVLGDKYRIFKIIRNVFGVVFGCAVIAYGIYAAIADSDWGMLIFSAIGLILFVQFLLMTISVFKEKNVDQIKKN